MNCDTHGTRIPASNAKQSRLNKSEQHCEKEGERKRAHNKMHDQPPAQSSPVKNIAVDLGFFSGDGSSGAEISSPRSGAKLEAELIHAA